MDEMQGKIIKEFRFKHGLSQEDLGKVLGVSKQYISKVENGKALLSNEKITFLESCYAVGLKSKNYIDDGCILVEHIGITPSCGKGQIIEEEPAIQPIKLGTNLISYYMKCSAPEKLKAFTASGDSMSPSIEDGDLLIVDTGRTNITHSGIFVFTVNNEWRCKRINLRLDGTLDIISDNRAYPPENLKPDTDLQIIIKGRVIKNMSRGL